MALELKDYIKSNFKTGDKLPSNNELAQIFNASIKQSMTYATFLKSKI
ncbi:MAG: hypothetical protein L6V95_10460 [Candidatus Melainabacteria bacterium]|nr:MAG: hypothetical protein L6V95_10460 [Candidatus Melainabacteria bacterium]